MKIGLFLVILNVFLLAMVILLKKSHWSELVSREKLSHTIGLGRGNSNEGISCM